MSGVKVNSLLSVVRSISNTLTSATLLHVVYSNPWPVCYDTIPPPIFLSPIAVSSSSSSSLYSPFYLPCLNRLFVETTSSFDVRFLMAWRARSTLTLTTLHLSCLPRLRSKFKLIITYKSNLFHYLLYFSSHSCVYLLLLISPCLFLPWRALSLSKMWGYEPHVKIVAEWDQWVKDWWVWWCGVCVCVCVCVCMCVCACVGVCVSGVPHWHRA